MGHASGVEAGLSTALDRMGELHTLCRELRDALENNNVRAAWVTLAKLEGAHATMHAALARHHLTLITREST